MRSNTLQSKSRSWLHFPSTPLGVFVILLALIFLVEATLMLLLPQFPLMQESPFLMVFLDSGLLVATLCPALWILVIRPIQKLALERGQLLQEQFSIQEVERNRLARELHDELGQIQTAILLTSKAARNFDAVQDLQEHLDSIHDLASSAIDATRRIAKGLSPGVLQDFGLVTGIGRLVEDCAVVGGPQITLSCRVEDVRFQPDIELAVYRVTQEALLNAIKHSGATRVDVSLAYNSGELVLEVQDNGSGIQHLSRASNRSGGLGLRGMRERLELVRGTFSILVQPDKGTTVRGRVPAKVLNT